MSKELLVAVIDDDEPFRTLRSLICLVPWGTGRADLLPQRSLSQRTAESLCDCAITDIHMSGMSGFDLKRLLSARDSKVPVIMITARAEPGLEAKAAAAGAVCLLRKPFDPSALIGCLDRALSGR